MKSLDNLNLITVIPLMRGGGNKKINIIPWTFTIISYFYIFLIIISLRKIISERDKKKAKSTVTLKKDKN